MSWDARRQRGGPHRTPHRCTAEPSPTGEERWTLWSTPGLGGTALGHARPPTLVERNTGEPGILSRAITGPQVAWTPSGFECLKGDSSEGRVQGLQRQRRLPAFGGTRSGRDEQGTGAPCGRLEDRERTGTAPPRRTLPSGDYGGGIQWGPGTQNCQRGTWLPARGGLAGDSPRGSQGYLFVSQGAPRGKPPTEGKGPGRAGGEGAP